MQPPNQHCDNCRFFKPSDGGYGGHCRRLPPQFWTEQLIETLPEVLDRATLRLTSGWFQPFVSTTEWCGEWLRSRHTTTKESPK